MQRGPTSSPPPRRGSARPGRWCPSPWGVEHLAAISTPTLLLTGSHTEPHHTAAIKALHDVLPHSEVAVLYGQGHMALRTAPDVLGGTVRAFLDRH